MNTSAGGHVLVEVRVQSLGVDRATKSPVVVLQEAEGTGQLPIWIGAAEASAIAMQLAGMSVGRPLTHDLVVSLLQATGGVLQRVLIPRVENNTYYAELEIVRGGETIRVDARPSDSIAIALRTDAVILADDTLLDRVILEVEEGDEPPSAPGPSASDIDISVEKGGEEEAIRPSDLESYLRSLDPEDFGRFTP